MTAPAKAAAALASTLDGARECVRRGLPSPVRQLRATSLKRFFINGAGEEVGLAVLQLPDVRLGSVKFGLQEGLESDDNANCGLPFDGVVGVTRLGLKWVAFDLEHRRFSWKR